MKRAALPCALILGGLSALHAYWAGGGTAFAEAAVPTRPSRSEDEAEQPLFEPPRAATLTVASALAVGALSVLITGFTGRGKRLTRLVALAFSLRAMGDFRYVGLTKRVKGTRFARRDSRIYTPLCLAVASLARSASR
ncbi:MAG: DUF3995 domain-containing protein [bacterium]